MVCFEASALNSAMKRVIGNRATGGLPDGQWCRFEAGGTVLGAFPDTTYEQGTVVLEPGSCLLVFSDGVSDAWSDHDEADRQLVKLVLARKQGEAPALRTEIFRAGERSKDDRTLILLERLASDVSTSSR